MPLYDYVTGQGVIIPDTSDLLTEVENEYKAALGEDFITDPNTPEGVLITTEVLARDAVVRNNAKMANQLNPNYSGGTHFDSIWALTGGERSGATKSSTTCLLGGVSGTVVPTSTRFRSDSDDLWAVETSVTIGVDGTVLATVIAEDFGPISAATGSITQIEVGPLGLETVTNTAPAALGQLVQSDQSARRERRNTLALQGVSLPISVMSHVYAVDGVRSMTFRENLSWEEATIDGVLMTPKSIYACVDGGSDEDVAMALMKKSLGAGWNGDVSVVITDPSSGQPYTVQFDRPDLIGVLARVTAKVTNPLINPQTAIRRAVLAYVNGEMEGEDGFVVGGSVSPFELASAINRQEPNIYVQKLEVALSSAPTFSVDEIPIEIFQKATISESGIQVIIP